MLGLGSIGDIAQWVAVVIIAGGMVLTWRKNGRSEALNSGKRIEKIASLEKVVGEVSSKQDNILESINAFKTHCAKVSTGLNGRITNLESKQGRRK